MSTDPRQLCRHCGLPIDPADRVVDSTQGEEYDFCCRGCRGAWQIIHSAGLESFYQRNDLQLQPSKEISAAQFDPHYLQNFITTSTTGSQISLIIDGIHCASCIWLIEKFLHQITGVHTARVNFATHRLLLCFDPDQVTIAELCQQLAQLGYLPRPYSQNEMRASLE
ncbi:MAG: heavy metal translocating P-type ATPase metal-binding domain-containing protein, partial [Geopsychrobacter sp.]|nr:heavy metal translocating P-type ATPase metal-binding domain-containing protein [Geopsychrobacter sp.]